MLNIKNKHITYAVVMLLIIGLFWFYFYAKNQGFRISIYQKEDKFFDGSYYENTSGKPELRICALSNDANHNIYLEFKVFKEIFEELGYFVQPAENDSKCDVAINAGFPKKKVANPSAFKIYLEMEPKEPIFEGYDLAIGYIYSDLGKYFRLPLYYLYFTDKISDQFNRGQCNPHKKHFACFLVSNANPFSERAEFFKKLSAYKKVASAGLYLNNIGYSVPRSINETLLFMQDCKFVIAYENTPQMPGYITEKPFQAYIAGAIPIYNAHEKSMQDINANAVIYSPDFSSDQEVIEYIKKLDNDDDLYCQKWREPIIQNHHRSYQEVKEQLKQKIKSLFKPR